MWRGRLSSFRYSTICLSESWRPNQVFHQNKKGMSTISQAVRKKSRRLRVDMRCRVGAGWREVASVAMAGGSVDPGEGGGLAVVSVARTVGVVAIFSIAPPSLSVGEI